MLMLPALKSDKTRPVPTRPLTLPLTVKELVEQLTTTVVMPSACRPSAMLLKSFDDSARQ